MELAFKSFFLCKNFFVSEMQSKFIYFAECRKSLTLVNNYHARFILYHIKNGYFLPWESLLSYTIHISPQSYIFLFDNDRYKMI